MSVLVIGSANVATTTTSHSEAIATSAICLKTRVIKCYSWWVMECHLLWKIIRMLLPPVQPTVPSQSFRQPRPVPLWRQIHSWANSHLCETVSFTFTNTLTLIKCHLHLNMPPHLPCRRHNPLHLQRAINKTRILSPRPRRKLSTSNHSNNPPRSLLLRMGSQCLSGDLQAPAMNLWTRADLNGLSRQRSEQ